MANLLAKLLVNAKEEKDHDPGFELIIRLFVKLLETLNETG